MMLPHFGQIYTIVASGDRFALRSYMGTLQFEQSIIIITLN